MNFVVVTCNYYAFRRKSTNIVGTSKIRSNYYYTYSLIMLLSHDSNMLFLYILSLIHWPITNIYIPAIGVSFETNTFRLTCVIVNFEHFLMLDSVISNAYRIISSHSKCHRLLHLPIL